MQIHKILLNTKAEGPGIRACIWVQGCHHGCKGCFAKHLWDFEAGKTISVDEIIDSLKNVIAQIDGITFLGGEPMEQAEELAQIAKYVREAGKNVITFTGYVYEQLLTLTKPGVKELLECTDLLADGPFVEELINYDRPMLGSANQRFIYLTDAINPELMDNYKNSFELRIDSNGKVQVNGMGDLKKLEKYLDKIDGGYHEITNI